LIDSFPAGVVLTSQILPQHENILTPPAIEFITTLARRFEATRKSLLQARLLRQQQLNQGTMPNFLDATAHVRESDWQVAPIPADLQDRRVEITGPASDRKMVINALNSGAKVFMADFEDANSPTWENSVGGQQNLFDAVRHQIDYASPEGKAYALNSQTAVLMIRPRGWHLTEKHLYVDGQPISASLFDFGLFFFHNTSALLEQNTGPYFYLPKLESHEEAQLWADVFKFSESQLQVPPQSIRATVLIETILAAFEMDEILYELKDYAAGLNCGRWDYIFSYIKKLRQQPQMILPDRSLVTMSTPFMRAYSLLAIQTCHRRNAAAIGGMAAQIPVKNDATANEAALSRVRIDKEREVTAGHDGTWVAHPALVPVATAVFDQHMTTPNQIQRKLESISVAASDLLEVPQGPITEAGLRINISVGIQYIEAWLRGFGAVPIFHLMEDAATAEISRAQVWQWIRHDRGVLEDGRKITIELFEQTLAEEIQKIQNNLLDQDKVHSRIGAAAELFRQLTLSSNFEEFLTLPGYQILE